jgi:hypothetical protein
LEALDYPMLETQNEWLMHGFSYANYLAELVADAQSEIYKKSSVDLALRDAFRKMRHFLMTTKKLSTQRVASPPLSPAVRNNRLPAATPRPWPDLSPETQIQIARILAGLLRRMRPAHVSAAAKPRQPSRIGYSSA